MRTISSMYAAYRVPPWLQDHQLRVAAVGEWVAQMHATSVSVQEVVTACLLHDIGAIVKFDFSASASLRGLCPPHERDHWRLVQREMQATYGHEEHVATDMILSELSLTPRIRDIVGNTGLGNMERMLAEDRLDVLIVQYADMRVSPTGIVSIEERLHDVKERYSETLKKNGRYDSYDQTIGQALAIEERLFRSLHARPEDCTDELFSDRVRSLVEYVV